MDFGWKSLLPPLIAIFLAISFRRVIPALGAAIVVAAYLLAIYSPVDQNKFVLGLDILFREQLYGHLMNWDKQRVFIFSLTLGAMVGVIESVGGMEALVQTLIRRVKTRRGGQVLVWILGLGVFFDDYANSLLLGTTMRSTADRLRFSRAKLAYLVDSTAAPVAGLAIVSTWVATEISYIDGGLRAAGVASQVTAFSVFMESIAFRFYAVFALALVFIIAWTNRDFGPMLAAEQDSIRNGNREGDMGNVEGKQLHYPPFYWLTAVLPVSLCVLVVLGMLVKSGKETLVEEGRLTPELTGIQYWGEVFGSSDSYNALVWGSGVGLLTALLLGFTVSRVPAQRIFLGLFKGALHILPAMVILWLAWALSGMTDEEHLNTGGYLSDLLAASGMPGWTLPSAVFAISGLVALATGTSWGTMALLTPLSIKLAVTAGATSVGEAAALADGGPLLVAVVGAVLAGSIFGDHCSPISDTTVLSSRASGCDHILHVRTQMPYALLGGGVAVFLGTIPSGLGFPAPLSLALGIVVLWLGVMMLGTRADQVVEAEASADELD